MGNLILSIPTNELNKLNNFYLSEFGYEIHTQLLNFIHEELKRCKNYPEDKPEPMPKPSIKTRNGEYMLMVEYPDEERLRITVENYSEAVKLLNEWSKYSFSKEGRDKVLMKYYPEKIPCIQVSTNNKYCIKKYPEGTNRVYQFGCYDTIEDACLVKQFLVEHNWDLKYQPSNYYDEGYSWKTASNHLLELIKEGKLE